MKKIIKCMGTCIQRSRGDLIGVPRATSACVLDADMARADDAVREQIFRCCLRTTVPLSSAIRPLIQNVPAFHSYLQAAAPERLNLVDSYLQAADL